MDFHAFLEKLNFPKVLRIAIGSSLAIFVAETIGLEYSTSAGIITFLTVQDTKRETLKLAVKRLLSYFVTIALAMIFLHGTYDYVKFGLFMLFLVGISYLADWSGAISVNAVIGTHFLMKMSFEPSFALNELILVLIGSAFGVLVNLYMPKKDKRILKDIARLETQMSFIVSQLSIDIETLSQKVKGDRQLEDLEKALDKTIAKAYHNFNNTLRQHSTYFISYLEMRKNQCVILEGIRDSIYGMTHVPEEAELIAAFVRHIGETIHEEDNVSELREMLNMIFEHLEESPLPVTRKEFENRALLYHTLKDFEEFLLVKEEFIESLTEEQLELYWEE